MAFPDEGTSFFASSGNDPVEPEEVYGPLRFRRYVKGDGRALILYTHVGPTQDAAAQDGPAHT
jgi:hypothetical protein